MQATVLQASVLQASVLQATVCACNSVSASACVCVIATGRKKRVQHRVRANKQCIVASARVHHHTVQSADHTILASRLIAGATGCTAEACGKRRWLTECCNTDWLMSSLQIIILISDEPIARESLSAKSKQRREQACSRSKRKPGSDCSASSPV